MVKNQGIQSFIPKPVGSPTEHAEKDQGTKGPRDERTEERATTKHTKATKGGCGGTEFRSRAAAKTCFSSASSAKSAVKIAELFGRTFLLRRAFGGQDGGQVGLRGFRVVRGGRPRLFLKNPADWKAEEKQCFEELRRKDLKVTKAWGLRETFQSFWQFTSKTAARAFFSQWLQKAKDSALRPITKVAVMLHDHLQGLLNYVTHRVTNAVTEGFNSKIQMIKSCARGFRSFENYRVATLFHCGKLHLHP